MDWMIPRKARSASAPTLRDPRGFDSIFDDLWRGFELAPRWQADPSAARFLPRIDVRETENEWVVSAELPGLEEKDFDITLEENVLTLKGEKRVEKDEEKAGLRHVESSSGYFERRLGLPFEVDPESVKATFKNGVLSVTLPKPATPEPQVRTIPVEPS